jgi:septum site-determining protein MinC
LLASPFHSLQQTGTFLVPTVRIPRGSTPSSITADLSRATNSSPSARNLLSNKNNGVPLVVDLAAFCPDGSPHFVPLREGELNAIIDEMRVNGLIAIAVTNSGTGDGVDKVAANCGLPTVMRGVGGNRGGGQGQGGEVNIADMLNVVTDGRYVPPDVRVASVAPGRQVEVTPLPLDQEDEDTAKAAATALIFQQEVDKEVERRLADARPSREHNEQQSIAVPLPLAPPLAPPLGAKIYHGHIRSGQQVSAEGTSLVVLGSVNSGGEAIADGDIHIYGKLKGRALAGLGENGKGGRIYAGHFDAELVCVAGVFTTVDDVADLGMVNCKGGMVWLDDEDGELKFKAIERS